MALILVPAAFTPFWAFRYEPIPALGTDPSLPEVATPLSQSESPAIALPLTVSPPKFFERHHQVVRGDTIIEILVDAGISAADAHRMVKHLTKFYRPADVRPGQKFSLLFNLGEKPGSHSFAKLIIRPAIDYQIILTPAASRKYRVAKQTEPLTTQTRRTKNTIRSNLYDAAVEARMPPSLLMELVRIFSWDIDFQREIREGDQFEAMFEQIDTEAGIFVRYGRLLYAQLTVRGKPHPLYLYTTSDGFNDYFDAKGHTARKALMKTPINGARLSSRYGPRRHPILGYNKMHRGLDFAAPSGTPIYAAGSGTVVYRARNGAYGNYLRIRHNSEYSTAYGHLSRFAAKARKGVRVKQGQVIGYVGSTGRSTGPHLHYEVLRQGRQINPMRLKMPSGRRLKGKELVRYQAQRMAYDDWFAALPNAKDSGDHAATANTNQ